MVSPASLRTKCGNLGRLAMTDWMEILHDVQDDIKLNVTVLSGEDTRQHIKS
jgi:hypothetical protein